MRSLLFVPGDDEKKLAKGASSGADVLLIDLEDAVAPARKAAARAIVADYLKSRAGDPSQALYVRINALETGLTDADLDGVMPGAPHGIMLPKAGHGRDIAHLGAKLAVREAETGLPDGGTQIVAIAPEQANAFFGMGTFAGASARLAGLTWGAEDLAADLGALGSRDAEGRFRPPMHTARMACLYGAAAAGVAAIDTVFTAIKDEAGLRAEAEEARSFGYTAKLAIHPAQVAIINEVFTPSAEAVAHARAIVAAFAEQPGAGVLNINGKMVDRPHIRAAEALLARAAAAGLG
jgi:citrate lyase subunit beta/citryl-CoA lyase